jgi:hypothetical protein
MPSLAWRERSDTPAPGGLVALGAAAHAVVRALAQRDAAQLAGLSAVAAGGAVVLLGPPEHLPWAQGVRYCAPSADVPALWLPTRTMPALPADLVHAALQRRAGGAVLLLWTAPDFVLPLDDPAPVDAAVLAWLERELRN